MVVVAMMINNLMNLESDQRGWSGAFFLGGGGWLGRLSKKGDI